jgi:hypothetical protein
MQAAKICSLTENRLHPEGTAAVFPDVIHSSMQGEQS